MFIQLSVFDIYVFNLNCIELNSKCIIFIKIINNIQGYSAYLRLEMDHGFWYVEMHNMACDIQLVVFPNNMVLLFGFSKIK